jgi:hypothetical protein
MSAMFWIRIAILTVFAAVVAQTQVRVPKIWDDAALKEWATPVAGLGVRPDHYTSAEYYSVPADNLRTYPVYHPDNEPPGYWEWLQKQKPEPLVDIAKIKTNADWIAAGQRAFREIDSVLLRTADPALIAQARNPSSFGRAVKLPDGSVVAPRWVVTSAGVMLTAPACSACHVSISHDQRVVFGGPRTPDPRGGPQLVSGIVPLLGAAGTALRLRKFYAGDRLPMAFWREFAVPWAPDERVERMKTMSGQELQELGREERFGQSFSGGVFARSNGSPFYVTKIIDLQGLQYQRYMDATATHRLRGPEDVARYAALVTGADRMDFGPHRMLPDEQRKVRFRYADEVLYAVGMYLMSLEPPKNPNPAPGELVTRGEGIFRREGCAVCHVPPAYTTGKLTLAQGWKPPPNHPNRDDIVNVSVGTDPGAALKTRKGTGLYKIPSLRGVWYRPLLLHDGSIASLEEMFDPARLSPEHVPGGWKGPGVTKRAVPGHPFGLDLKPEEKVALLGFLRSL